MVVDIVERGLRLDVWEPTHDFSSEGLVGAPSRPPSSLDPDKAVVHAGTIIL